MELKYQQFKYFPEIRIAAKIKIVYSIVLSRNLVSFAGILNNKRICIAQEYVHWCRR